MQSGVDWNDSRSIIGAEDAQPGILFPKIGKFKTTSLPLFEALGELYDGQRAEGIYDVNSTQLPQHSDLTRVDSTEDLSHTEATFPTFEETWAYNVQEDADLREKITIDLEHESVASTELRMNKRVAATKTRNNEEKEIKMLEKQSSNKIAGSMDRFIEMRERQFAIESSQLAGEKVGHARDYSIKRCISEMMKMALSINEKAATVDVLKDTDNREMFLSSKEDDPLVALVWLRNAVAKMP